MTKTPANNWSCKEISTLGGVVRLSRSEEFDLAMLTFPMHMYTGVDPSVGISNSLSRCACEQSTYKLCLINA